MRPPPRRSFPLQRRTLAILFALFVLTVCVLSTLHADTPDAADPHSVEWVCANAPERVRALFDSLNLERRGFEKIRNAVGDGDYPAACNALIAYYKSAPTAKWLRVNPLNQTAATDPECAGIMADEFTFYGDRAKLPRTAKGGISWSYQGPKNDQEWGFALSRQEYFEALISAYKKTGNRAYIERIDQDVRDWVLSNPPPGKMTKTGQWRGIDVSTRPRYWMQVFYGLQPYEEFSPAARILMLSSIAEHAQYLMVFHRRDANNWTVAEMTGLGMIGCGWPEFSDAPGWRAYSQEQMGRLMKDLVYPDGAEAELTTHYHRRTTENYETYLDTFRRFKYPVADSLEVGIKRMWSYLAFTLRPDGTAPQNNDSDIRNLRDMLTHAANVHDRPDWVYIASNGRDGRKPRIGPSLTFPWAGHTVMRSGWESNALWSFFDAGPAGVAHQHRDKLHLSIDAFGRPLLVDTGRFHYSKGPYQEYFTGSAGHNVIMIDGASQSKGPDRAERPMAGGDYGSMSNFDYARGIFDAGYQGIKGRAVHTRTVVYVHDEMWIVADRVETDRARRVDALWHFAPDCHVTTEGKTVVSTDAGLGNLRIAPIGGMPWRTRIVSGVDNPVQGWYSSIYTEKVAAPTAIYSADIPGTTTFAWVLLPAEGEVPAVDARVVSSGADRIEVRVQAGPEKAFVVTIPMNSWRPSVRREG